MANFHTCLDSVGFVAAIESRSRGFCHIIYSFVHSQSGRAACSDCASQVAGSLRLGAVICCPLCPARLLDDGDTPSG